MTETRQNPIRKMTPDDLAQVVAIEQAATISPWTAVQFEESLRNHHCLVLCDNDSAAVIGYAIVSTLLDRAEVLNICISTDHQGNGHGSRLLTKVIDQLPAEIEVVFLEVRVSNFAAIRLYYNHGFVEVGQRRDYYATEFGREDAILMNLNLA